MDTGPERRVVGGWYGAVKQLLELANEMQGPRGQGQPTEKELALLGAPGSGEACWWWCSVAQLCLTLWSVAR